jgi:hypothetical protein
MAKMLTLIFLTCLMFISCEESSPTESKTFQCNWFLDSSGAYDIYYYVNSYPEEASEGSAKYPVKSIKIYPDDGFYVLYYLTPETNESVIYPVQKDLPSSFSYEEM